jgi:hypothetical protein
MKATIQSRDGLKTMNLTRRRAIREGCLNCSSWSLKEVRECIFKDCPLYPYRSGQGRQNAATRVKAIKAYCLWCMAGEKAEIKRCVSAHCALFIYRRGTTEKASPLLKTPHIEQVFEANSPDPMGKARGKVMSSILRVSSGPAGCLPPPADPYGPVDTLFAGGMRNGKKSPKGAAGNMG